MRLNLVMWEKQNNFKAKDVAKKLGMSETTYSLIKNGKTTPSLDLLYKFKETFEVDDETLVKIFKKEG